MSNLYDYLTHDSPATDVSSAAPMGMELQLTGVPNHISAYDLKWGLRRYLICEYNISVILEKPSEELFWESFDPPRKDHGMTARVTVPNNSDGKNPAAALIGQTITILCRDGENAEFRATEIFDSETPNHKYEELRKGSSFEPTLRDGQIGDLYKVSCGTFNDKKFETAHAWSYEGSKFKKLSYFDDAKLPKFRICLPEEDLGTPLEWMDFHESNVRGLIFGHSKIQTHQVVYFVVDKPPQFYQRCNLVNSRISHPSSLQRYADDELDVCGVPWIIQYSRVFKVEYIDNRDQSFDICTVHPLQMKKQMEGELFFSFEQYLDIAESERTVSDMVSTIRSNIRHISKLFPPYLTGCQLGVVKLLYNCNISATSPETTLLLSQLIGHGLPRHSRQYSERLHKWSEDINTSHFRALEDFQWDPDSIILGDTRTPDEPRRKPLYGPLFPDVPTDLAVESTQWHEDSSPGIFEVLVYPSHIEIRGPTDPPLNSVRDEYRYHIGRFLRVKFVDNNSKPLKVEAGIDLAKILEHRVFRVLTDQTQLLPPLRDLTGFEFLGYSMSSLKKRKAVWFFQRQDGLGVKEIRGQIGDWDVRRKANTELADHPSKWGARISLAFTESRPVLSLSRADWALRDDVYGEVSKIRNTDGCGLISPELCDTINAALAPFGFASSRAFQIRFGGVKGVVYAGANSLLEYKDKSYKMLLRKSQLKFQVPDDSKLDLRIVSTAGDGHQSLFFASALKAFEDSDADTKEVKRIYGTTYNRLRRIRFDDSNGLDLLRQILRIPYNLSDASMKGRHSLLRLAIRLKEEGIHPHNYSDSFLACYLTKLAERARDKDLFNIPIPGSFSLLGLTDDYKVLESDEVFIRAQAQTIKGPVLIYRDPIIHIGDIQRAEALGEDVLRARLTNSDGVDGGDRVRALLSMNNIIFFSQKDDPPFPNRLSGGDLDGDRFEILTKNCDFWGDAYETRDYDSYTEDKADRRTSPKNDPDEEHDSYTEDEADRGTSPPKNDPDKESFSVKRLAEFIMDYIRNDCFAELEHRLLALADQKEDQEAEGMNDANVKDLAKWLSKAVDYAKSGKEVDLVGDVFKDSKFNVQKKKPDFLRALSRRAVIDSSAGYYESTKLLGKIYRRFERIEYDYPYQLDNRDLVEKLAQDWAPEVKKLKESKLGEDLTNFLSKVDLQAERYREQFYREGASEVIPFLRKQQGDILNNFVQELIALISDAMVQCKIVTWSGMGPLRVRPQGSHGRDTVEAMYRQCLYSAWERSIPCDDDDDYGYSKSKWGHGYAFLCLYALYCEELPIDT